MDKETILSIIHSYRIPLENGCYEWSGGKSAQNYPILHIQGKPYRVNRLIVSFKYNLDLNSGFIARHTCDFPPCTNEDHLIPGTSKDNTQDMVDRKRHRNNRKTHCKWGHEFTPQNTRRAGKNRRCKTCHNSASHAQNRKNKLKKKITEVKF